MADECFTLINLSPVHTYLITIFHTAKNLKLINWKSMIFFDIFSDYTGVSKIKLPAPRIYLAHVECCTDEYVYRVKYDRPLKNGKFD